MQQRSSSTRQTVARTSATSAPLPTAPAPRRRTQSSHFVPSSDLRRVQGMNRQLDRITNRIEQKLLMYRQEAESSQFLLARARRLTDRLDVLKHKLRMCFDMCGAEHPPHLQFVLQQMQLTSGAMDPDDAPPEFICPITQSVMIDPVRTADGHAYDRAAIYEWFVGFEAKGQCPTSPLTNLPLVDTTLCADATLRQQIQDFLAAHCSAPPGSVEEPSLRQAPPALPAPPHQPVIAPAAAVPVPVAAASHRGRPTGAPIWSSSVVPPNEANSRELNQLRMSDLDVPGPSGLVGSRITSTTSASTPVLRQSTQSRAVSNQQVSEVSGFRDQQRRLQLGLISRGLLPGAAPQAVVSSRVVPPLSAQASSSSRQPVTSRTHAARQGIEREAAQPPLPHSRGSSRPVDLNQRFRHR